MAKRIFEVYRYDPDKDAAPRMQTYELEPSTSACCSTHWSS